MLLARLGTYCIHNTFTLIHSKYIESLLRITGGIWGVHYISGRVFGLAICIQIFVDALGGATDLLHNTGKILKIDHLRYKQRNASSTPFKG